MYIVGTPANVVTLSRSIISSALPGSKRGSSVSSARARTVTFMTEFMPKTWKSGSVASVDGVRPGVDEVARGLGAGGEVRVHERRALRRPGGARRVDDHGRVVVLAVGDLLDRVGAAERLLELAGRGEDALRARLLRAALGGLGEAVPGDDQLGARVGEVVRDLARLEQRVHRHDDRAEPQRAEVDDGEVGHVREHQPDAVARPDAVRAQQPGGALGAGVEQRVVQDEVVELDRGPVRGVRDRGCQLVGKVGQVSSSDRDARCCCGPQLREVSDEDLEVGRSRGFQPTGAPAVLRTRGEARPLARVRRHAQQGALHRPDAHDHAEHAGVEGLRPGDVQADGRPEHRACRTPYAKDGFEATALQHRRPTSSARSSTRRPTGRPSTRASTSCRRPTRSARWS